MKKDYGKDSPAELSREKLRWDEIFVILTGLNRAECGGYVYYEAIKKRHSIIC